MILATMKLREVAARGAFAVALVMLVVGCDGELETTKTLASPSDAAVLSESCMTLDDCCPSLPIDVGLSCHQLALQAGSTECGTELSLLTAAGQCLAQAVTPSDAGSKPDAARPSDASIAFEAGASAASTADAGSAIACVLLEACCTSAALPSDETATCQSIQGGGDESQCTALLDDLTASQDCGSAGGAGSGGACPELAQCCTSVALPANFVATCDQDVMTGDDTTCGSTLAALASSGFCGGSVTTADGGEPQDPSCATLAMCCNEITFPTSTLSTCQSIAGANVGGTCQSALDGYVALNYCVDGS